MDPLRLVLDQAEDEGLWGQAETAMEAYVQAALRELHAAVELAASRSADAPAPQGPDWRPDHLWYPAVWAAEEAYKQHRNAPDRLRHALAAFGRAYLANRAPLPPPSGEPSDPYQEALRDFFVALGEVAEQMDEQANGPNPPGILRSLHAVAIPMRVILDTRKRCETNRATLSPEAGGGSLAHALGRARDAIQTAIYCEDGLDGGIGAEVLDLIDAALRGARPSGEPPSESDESIAGAIAVASRGWKQRALAGEAASRSLRDAARRVLEEWDCYRLGRSYTFSEPMATLREALARADQEKGEPE